MNRPSGSLYHLPVRPRTLLTRVWNRLGLATAHDTARAAERIGKRLDRWEKRAERAAESRNEQATQAAAIAGTLEELKASVGKLQGALDTTSDQLQRLAVARKGDLQAVEDLPRFAATLEQMAGAVDAHLERTMARAQVARDPFPHIIIDEFLPPALYRTMLETLPPADFWSSSGYSRDYWEIESHVGPWRTELVWRFVDRRVVDGMLRPRLEQAFSDDLAPLWRESYGVDPARVRYRMAEGRLQLRRKGYRLRPHLDPPHAALTGLMYLARPGDDARYGTALYRPLSPIPVKRQGIYYPEDHGIALENVGMVPFKANSLLVWMTALGPHGADLTADDVPKSLERYTYHFQLLTDDETRRRIKAR